MCRSCGGGIRWQREHDSRRTDDQIPSNVEVELGFRKNFRESRVPDPQWSWIIGARAGYTA